VVAFALKIMAIEYSDPTKFVLDGVRFSFQGKTYKGQGFMEWNPATGFRIDALLDKTFAPLDAFKTLGQIIVNTKEDIFSIRLAIRGHGRGIARAFPLAQQGSLFSDNHLCLSKLQRVLFFLSRLPKEFQSPSQFWSGSALYFTANKLEFPDPLNTKTELNGRLIFAKGSTGLSVDEDGNWCLSGRQISDDKFELRWSLNKNRWRRNDAWRFGEAARRALSIISAQVVWIAKQELSRDGQRIEELRKRSDPKELSYYFWPLLGDDMGGVERWKFNKTAFLKLTEFFLRGSPNAETCWKIFSQMADASRQKTGQGQELLLATILEAVFRTINNRPFKVGDYYPEKKRRADMEQFRTNFFSDKWVRACDRALELHSKLRHRNAHPDWLTSPDGTLSKKQLKESYADSVFLSRFYGYMILGMAGFKDLEPRFPNVRFSDEA
jgi:hypothetical protein